MQLSLRLLLRKLDFYEEYAESNILPQKVVLLQLHITCEKVTYIISYITIHLKSNNIT